MTDQDAEALYSALKRLWDERHDDWSYAIHPSPETIKLVKDILKELGPDAS